jgi:hypothetical protein
MPDATERKREGKGCRFTMVAEECTESLNFFSKLTDKFSLRIFIDNSSVHN